MIKIYDEYLIKNRKLISEKSTRPVILLKVLPLILNTFIPLLLFEAFWSISGCPLSWVTFTLPQRWVILTLCDFCQIKTLGCVLFHLYSLDLAQEDFWMFLKVEMTTKENILNWYRTLTQGSSKDMAEDFWSWFRKWQGYLDTCVWSERKNSEGDYGQCVFYWNNF